MIQFMRFKSKNGTIAWYPVGDVEQVLQVEGLVRVWIKGRSLGGEDFAEMLDPV